MKKSIVWLTATLCAFVLLFSACQPSVSNPPSDSVSATENFASEETESNSKQTDNSNSPASQASSNKNSSDTGNLPEYKPGSIKLEPQDLDDYTFTRKYRITYYQIWGEFTDLLSEDARQDFMNWADEESKKNGYGEHQNEMLLVSFVKRYNISRTDFDKAVKVYIDTRNKTGEDLYSEENEVPNGDIIYTFDNEIINRYYRYE